MKIKALFLTTLIYGILGIHAVNADPTPLSTIRPYIPQIYAGVSVGVQRMKGNRSESVFADITQTTPPPKTIVFSDLTGFSNNNGFYSAHLGCTWDILQSLIFIGPEVYLGRGSAASNLKKDVSDLPDSNTKRTLDATIRQLTFWGGTLQIGLNCKWNSKVYLLLGAETSQFEYSGSYIPRSQSSIRQLTGLGPLDDYPTTVLNTRKWLSGFVWGLGMEKIFSSIKVGFDIRVIKYRKFKSSYNALALEPETLTTLFRPQNIRFGLRISYLFSHYPSFF